jgi:hypothetical protein
VCGVFFLEASADVQYDPFVLSSTAQPRGP